MKQSELAQIGKGVVNYYKQQLELAEKDHDWTYQMTIKVKGTNNETNVMNITKQQFNKLKKIFL